jgi:hypothetical protein
MMRIFVFTYDRYDSITTAPMLQDEGLKHTVLCHSEESRERFIAAGRVAPERIVATGEPKGLANNRNAALEMMDDGEWAIFLVDDFINVMELKDYDQRSEPRMGITMENQQRYRDLFKHQVTMRRFYDRAHELVDACEAVGAHLGGFAGNTNPLFRDAKWRFNTLADGRAWVVKKSSLRFDTEAQMIDDVAWTAKNIERFGVTVVNQWILPNCSRYTAGAFGSIDERMDQKITEAAFLVRRYPGIVRVQKKNGWPAGSHVVLRRTLDGNTIRGLEQVVMATQSTAGSSG